jgi:hypothetical protein
MVQNCDLWYQPDSDNQWAFIGALESVRYILMSLESERKKHQKWVVLMDRTGHILLPSERANHYDNELQGSIGVLDMFYSMESGCKEKDIKTLASQSAACSNVHPPHLAAGPPLAADPCRRLQVGVAGQSHGPLLSARWPSSSSVSPHTLRKSLSSNKFNFQITGSDSGPIFILL